MNNPKHLQLLINIVGAMLGLFVIGYVVFAAFHTETATPCSAGYPAPMRFSLHNSQGKPLTAIELQARAGARDLGVVDNAAVVRTDGASAPEALEVKLRNLPDGSDPGASARNGIEFHWSPPGMADASAACLSYGLWLPEKFEFARGGHLPGVLGRDRASAGSGSTPAFAVDPQWDDAGRPLIAASLQGGSLVRISARAAPLPLGHWVRVDQEVVLNEPGKANGIARLWIDGNLVVENRELQLRRDQTALLSGVLVGIGYRTDSASGGLLRVSPFEIAWR